MTRDERAGIENGIWLCAIHATLIDRDEAQYTVGVLLDMKRAHEARCLEALRSGCEDRSYDSGAVSGVERLSELRQKAGHAITEAVARCFARWRGTGLSVELAKEFAENVDDGALAEVGGILDGGGLRFIVGEFGEGKSLCLERLLISAARDVLDHGVERRTFYFDARYRQSDHVIAEARDCKTLFALFVDNAEALGDAGLRHLIENLRALNHTRPQASIFITSRPLRAVIDQDETFRMPAFDANEARSLVRRIAPHASVDLLLEKEPDSLSRPIFAILAAQHPDISHRHLSRGDLLAFYAERIFSDLHHTPTAAELLRRLGVAQIDAGGDLVPISDIVKTTERSELLDSGYLTLQSSRGLVGFTLPILSQWFAAMAIEMNEVIIADFAGDETRLENWREVFMVRVATGSDTQVDQLFTDLVSVSAGFAVSLAQRDVTRWFTKRSEPRPEALAYAKRLRYAVDVLLAALGAFAEVTPYADADGTLGLGVRIDAHGSFVGGWTKNRTPKVFELPQTFSPFHPTPGFAHSTYAQSVDVRPAWNWRSASSSIGKALLGFFEWRDYTSVRSASGGRQISFEGSGHERELAWQSALAMLGKGSLFPDPVEIRPLLEQGIEPGAIIGAWTRFYDSRPLLRVLEGLSLRSISAMEPPWPTPEEKHGQFVWSGFSKVAMIERIRVVYEGALNLYGEIVRTCFGKFAARMPLFAAMPFVLHVTLIPTGNEERFGPVGEWKLLPKHVGPSIVMVDEEPPTSESGNRAAYEQVVRQWPKFSSYAEYMHVHGAISVFDDMPMGQIAHKWLEDDIKALFGVK